LAPLLLLLAGVNAAAQETAAPVSAPPSPDQITPSVPDHLPPADSEKPAEPFPTPPPGEVIGVLGKKVRGPNGEDMGRVVDVLVDAEGKPRAAIIDFGGFLGVGSRKIAIDWTSLQVNPAERDMPVHLGLSRAEVQAAPEYKETPPPAPPPPPPPPATTGSSDAGR
jgi:hypothetical protein